MLNLHYKNTDIEIDYFLHHGSQKTLLYIHGGACSKENFFQSTENELSEYTIVAFDLPGCGHSSYPPHLSLDVDDLTEITRLIVTELNLSKPVILGHSLGGLIALLYIERYKDASAFINIEGNLAEENCLFSMKVANTTYDEFKNQTLPRLLKDLKSSANPGFRKWADSLQHSSAKAFYDCCASIVEYSVHGQLLDKYIALDIPTLYIYGSENREDLRLLKRLKENDCKTAEIPNSNHFLFHDNPEAFYKTVSEFLKEINKLSSIF